MSQMMPRLAATIGTRISAPANPESEITGAKFLMRNPMPTMTPAATILARKMSAIKAAARSTAQV